MCDDFVRDPVAVRAYRLKNPWSRAENLCTLYGSSAEVRRGTCIFCRELIATCSARWPYTKTFMRQINDHVVECSKAWMSRPENSLFVLAATDL